MIKDEKEISREIKKLWAILELHRVLEGITVEDVKDIFDKTIFSDAYLWMQCEIAIEDMIDIVGFQSQLSNIRVQWTGALKDIPEELFRRKVVKIDAEGYAQITNNLPVTKLIIYIQEERSC